MNVINVYYLFCSGRAKKNTPSVVTNFCRRRFPVLLLLMAAGAASAQTTELFSTAGQLRNDSLRTAFSADGRWVVFSSDQFNIVTDDVNGHKDIFLHDLISGETQIVSVSSSGEQGNGASDFPAISSDGSYIAFESSASNLAAGDANQARDIFIHNRVTGATLRASVAANGAEANGASRDASISADGQSVAFTSAADNLVANDANASEDVFVRKLSNAKTLLASVSGNGARGNADSYEASISGNGRFVSFTSLADNLSDAGDIDNNNNEDIFVRDLDSATTERVSVNGAENQANGASFRSLISFGGRYVMFHSDADNLVANDTNDSSSQYYSVDLFVRDRLRANGGLTSRVNVSSSGYQTILGSITDGAGFSFDGTSTYVTFLSNSDNLRSDTPLGLRDEYYTYSQYHSVAVYIHSLATGVTEEVSVGFHLDQQDSVAPSADGSHVLFTSYHGDAVGDRHFYLRDRLADSTARQPILDPLYESTPNADSYNAAVSDDGVVVFQSDATNLFPRSGEDGDFTQIFAQNRVYDFGDGYIESEPEPGLISFAFVNGRKVPGNDRSRDPAISASGRRIVFSSFANNLIPDDTNNSPDIFLLDYDFIERVNISSAYQQANAGAHHPAISGDGRVVAFESIASNLVDGDDNGEIDVFVRNLTTGITERVSVDSAGTQTPPGDSKSADPALSADGRFVAFWSAANSLVIGDTNNAKDIFLHDRETGITERVSVSSAGAQANAGSFVPTISADGRFVAFRSSASNLVPGDNNNSTDIFVRDRQLNTTSRVSVAASGAEANGFSDAPQISANGRFVAFLSAASNLVGDDDNLQNDIFLHDRASGVTERLSVASTGAQSNGDSAAPAIGSDGRFVIFDSDANNLDPRDANTIRDLYIRDRGLAFQRPVANAGGIIRAECTGPITAVQLDGSRSYAASGGPLSYTWSGPFGTLSGVRPVVNLANGEYDISLTVVDGSNGYSDTSAGTILVRDTDRPRLNIDTLTVNVSAGAAAENAGSYVELCAPGVNLTASRGTIVDDGNGGWNWSLPTAGLASRSFSVQINVDDGTDFSRRFPTTRSFQVNVGPANGDLEVALNVGSQDNGQYGRLYGSNRHYAALFTTFSTDAGTDLQLSVNGYDVDQSTEVAVYLNGGRLGHLRRGPNNALNAGDSFLLPAALLVNGRNQIEFRQANPGWKWGVTNLLVSDPNAGPPVALDVGVQNDGRYGRNYGSKRHYDALTATFNTDAGADLQLGVSGYDIDKTTEVAVLLNGNLIGHLRRGPNNGLNAGNSFTLPAAQLNNGQNLIVFQQATPGWKWGVTKLLVALASGPPEVPPDAFDELPPRAGD